MVMDRPKNLPCAHTAFFFKFVSRANSSNSYPPSKRLKMQKMWPLKSFWNKPPSNPASFEQRGPRSPKHDYLNITSAQKWHSAIFQISAEKSFRAWQNGSCTFWYNFGVVICKYHVVRPTLLSFNKCRKFLLSSLETFFCRNLENVGISFLG